MNEKMREKLLELGFEPCTDVQTCSEVWQHKLVQGEYFDFSATSREGIIKVVFGRGLEEGRRIQNATIMDALGLNCDCGRETPL